MATLTSPLRRPVSVTQLDEEEVKLLRNDLVNARQDTEPLLRKLEGRKCPNAPRRPWDQCTLCLEGHPNHYPFKYVGELRDIMEQYYARIAKLLQSLAAVAFPERSAS